MSASGIATAVHQSRPDTAFDVIIVTSPTPTWLAIRHDGTHIRAVETSTPS